MNIFNIPNLLSISRILSVPIFIVLMFDPSPVRSLLACIVFSIASATDWLDGYLARRWGQVTKMGKLLDPIADKILIMAAMVTLVKTHSDEVPAWIAIIIIGREIAVTGLRSIASSEGIIIPAETMGKYKVAMQIVAVLALLLDDYQATDFLKLLGSYSLWAAMFLSIYSAGTYFRTYWKKLGAQRI